MNKNKPIHQSTLDQQSAPEGLSDFQHGGLSVDDAVTESAITTTSHKDGYEPATALGNLRQIVRDKTRFEPEVISEVSEHSVYQRFTVQGIHSLAALVEHQSINGFFTRTRYDNETTRPFAAASEECGERLRLASRKLRDLLGQIETPYNVVEAGCLLAATTKHWNLHRCVPCDGDGKVKCHTCHGSKNETCWKCYGSMYVTCDAYSCNGSGRVNCSVCSGSGQVSQQVAYQVTTTTWVNGVSHNNYHTEYRTEYHSCSACSFGKNFCHRCSGTGQIQCDVCHASGKITCRTCAGYGTLVCQPCEGSGKVGEAAWVQVNNTPNYQLIWPEDADGSTPSILDKEGPHGVVAASRDRVKLLTISEDSPQSPTFVRAHYLGELDIRHLEASCNGKVYSVTAYANDLRWLSLNGVLEDLLQRDLQALQNALNEALDEEFYSSKLDHILPALKHVSDSELNSDLVESSLNQEGGEGAITTGSIVSVEYAKQVKVCILGSLRMVYTRLALQYWWKLALIMCGAKMLVWLFGSNWVSNLAAIGTILLGLYMFNRQVKKTLNDTLGSTANADRAIDIAVKGKRNRVAMAILIIPSIVLLAILSTVLPKNGPWGGPTLHQASRSINLGMFFRFVEEVTRHS